MIRGIGPVYAKKLVRAFGQAVFDVIEQEPPRLREVTGIGPKRAQRIIAGWAEQKVIREIMLFLHSNSVGTSRAVRIYKRSGSGDEVIRSHHHQRRHRDQHSEERFGPFSLELGFAFPDGADDDGRRRSCGSATDRAVRTRPHQRNRKFADSRVEGGVSCELVSEVKFASRAPMGRFHRDCRKAAFLG